MSATLHNEKFRGKPEAWLLERADELADEIEGNLEENRVMQSDIEAIWEEIGRQANPRP